MTLYEAVGRGVIYIATCGVLAFILIKFSDIIAPLISTVLDHIFERDADIQDDFDIKSPEELAFEKRTLERQAKSDREDERSETD